ncbi:MAG: hypothetical protein COW24_05130, partial [Candidatus Kerfeldbacteria bacterium CG15_BIG_FIL_POST_REV_8_21_14_020_45_12]
QTDGSEVIINTDAGINIVEFGFLPFATLKECEENMKIIMAEFLEVAATQNATLIAYGIQPKTPYFYPDLKSEKIWYRGFTRFPALASGHSMFHNIAANQPCIDVTYEELLPAVNTLNAIAGVTIGLFANSGWGEWKSQDHHEMREYRWSKWMESPAEHQKLSGLPTRPFTSLRDYVAYNWDIRLPASHRGKTMHVIDPAPLINDYMHAKEWQAFDVGSSEPSVIQPSIEDANLSNMYIWIQARAKYYFRDDAPFEDFLLAYDSGDVEFDEFAREHLKTLYVEVRNVACQPWAHIMTAPAFFLGLIENLEAAEKVVKGKPWKYWVDLRQQAITNSLGVADIPIIAQELVEISEQGLKQRGLGEEKYIQVLFDRIDKRESPALAARRLADEFGPDALIKDTRIKL